MATTDAKKCTAKHTPYDPTQAEFRCPKCNAEAGVFAIDEPDADADEACEKLHVGDGLYCYDCKHAVSGRAFAACIQKTKGLVPCPTCRGHGLVKAKPAGGEGA